MEQKDRLVWSVTYSRSCPHYILDYRGIYEKILNVMSHLNRQCGGLSMSSANTKQPEDAHGQTWDEVFDGSARTLMYEIAALPINYDRA